MKDFFVIHFYRLSCCNETTLAFQMEEEEHTDRKQQLAMLYQKLNKIKKSLNEGNISKT